MAKNGLNGLKWPKMANKEFQNMSVNIQIRPSARASRRLAVGQPNLLVSIIRRSVMLSRTKWVRQCRTQFLVRSALWYLMRNVILDTRKCTSHTEKRCAARRA